ncbi:MAG: FecR domain-containing protein [Pseudomonadota bacterium]
MRAFNRFVHPARELLATFGLALAASAVTITACKAAPSNAQLSSPALTTSTPSAPSIKTGAPREATAPSAPGNITIGTASITYFARAGDTLTSIAQQYTDKGSNWKVLGKLNRIEKDSSIPVGTPIVIPGELLGDTPAKATVVAMTGTIAATAADGSTMHLTIGSTVVEGTQIQTSGNSFLTMALADQSRISVPSNSRLQMSKLRTARYLHRPRTEILLLRGRVESRVSPLEANQGRFEVRTPLSVAGVRGTQFRVGFVGEGADRRVATETLEGRVAVARASKSTAPDNVVLTQATGNIIDAKSVGPVVNLLPAPSLMPGGGTTGTEYSRAKIALSAVPGAKAYQLQIARDPEALNLLAENRMTLPALSIAGVPEGRYFARLSAIDRFGLEGLSSISPITLLRTNDLQSGSYKMPGAPKVAGSDSKTVTLRWTPITGQSMRLQLARNSDFSSLIVNRVSPEGEAQLARPPFGTYYARVEVLDEQGNAQVSSLAQPIIVTDQWIMNDGEPITVRLGRINATQ